MPPRICSVVHEIPVQATSAYLTLRCACSHYWRCLLGQQNVGTSWDIQTCAPHPTNHRMVHENTRKYHLRYSTLCWKPNTPIAVCRPTAWHHPKYTHWELHSYQAQWKPWKQHQWNLELPPWAPYTLTMLSLSLEQHCIGHPHCVLYPQIHGVVNGSTAAK